MISEETLMKLWAKGEISPRYKFWVRQPYLTRHEIVALSLNIDPRRIDSETFEDLSQDGGRLSTEYMERRALVGRHIEVGDLRADTSPGAVLRWLKSMEISTPDGLVAAFDALPGSTEMGDQTPDDAPDAGLKERLAIAESRIRDLEAENVILNQTDSASARAAATNERNSLMKLILAMAMGGYGYQPSKRSGIARDIVDDATRHGISISEDTVRKHFSTAADEVDRDDPKH